MKKIYSILDLSISISIIIIFGILGIYIFINPIKIISISYNIGTISTFFALNLNPYLIILCILFVG